MTIQADTKVLIKAIEKLERTKVRQEETLAATVGQLELFKELLRNKQTATGTKK